MENSINIAAIRVPLLACPAVHVGTRGQVIRGTRRAARGGKITLVTIFAILGLIVLAGLVGNAGHVVTAKIATQNAADAVAFSSAQWMARGMNAATATNHLVGEVTGLVVVLEGLGGPEADEGIKDYPLESKMLDKIIRTPLLNTAPMQGGYGASAFNGADKQFLKLIVDQVSPDNEEKAKSKAFATIYDAKMMLKRDLRTRLIIKTVANVGFMVPPPFGYATAAAAYIAHAHSAVEIVKIGKEWLILQGMELLARNVKPIKVTIFEEQLIPALSAHGDFIAGNSLNTGPVKTGIVNAGIASTLDHLGKIYGGDAAIYPGAMTFQLPVEKEPAPSLIGSKGKNEPEWGSDDPPADKPDDLLGKLQDQVDDQKEAIEQRIREIEWSISGGGPGAQFEGLPGTPIRDSLNFLEDKIDDLLELELTPDTRAKATAEKQQIRALRQKKQARIAELKAEMAKLDAKLAEMKKTLAEASNLPKVSGNLSIQHIPQDKLNQAEERYTQWVRATYPYVDAFRAPVLAQFDKHLEKSEAAKYYRKWTDRYALVKAWQFRSGYRFKKVSEKKGEWQKPANPKPLSMYVMKGAFAKSGARRDRKGHESWTLESAAAKAEAEKMFTVIGMTHRDFEPLFSPVVYPTASDGGITTFAQAIYYNGNEQKPAPLGAKQKTQAKVGWDTLNWDPATATPEWGAEPAKSSAKWPWEIFTSSPDLVGTAKVHLNWQAKLMPVTKSRFQEAAAASVVTSREMTESMVKAIPFFNPMVTH